MRKSRLWLPALAILLSALWLPADTWAQATLPGIVSQPTAGGGQQWSIKLQTLLLLSSLAFIPARGAAYDDQLHPHHHRAQPAAHRHGHPGGAPQPGAAGLALFLTFFVMSPVLEKVYDTAWQPLATGEISFEQFAETGSQPLREFMLAQTREPDIALFARLANVGNIQGPEELPLRVLLPAFVTSELKTAFQIGFTIFIPFLIIYLVVASVQMPLRMMMVPPATISLPFKLILFVLVDGWQLIIGSLAESFFL